MQSAGARLMVRGASITTLLVVAFAIPAFASAGTITVTSVADEADLAPGGGCMTAAGQCTLRAAIEEANAASGGGVEIAFDGAVFDGGVGSTIELSSDLPAISSPTRIDGGECMTVSGFTGPCVAVRGTNSGATLRIEADHVTIEGLDVFAASTAIEVLASRQFTIARNWFGTDLGGGRLGFSDGTAVLVGPGSDQGQIGGKEDGTGNLFVYANTGLDIEGASHIRVLGNSFGLKPGGDPAELLNFNTAIEIASEHGGGNEAVGNAIGTRLSPAAQATPACDGGCNVIGEAGSAIRMGGVHEDERPVETTVRGNYIGLDADGANRLPGNDDVFVSSGSVIGGPALGDANWIEAEVAAGEGPWEVRGNLLGVNFAGAKLPFGPRNGIHVFARGATGQEPVIAENLIEVAGGDGISVDGRGAAIVGNAIAGAEIGISLGDANDGLGSLVEGNLVEEAGTDGIMIENDFNEVMGNAILGSGFDGVGIFGRNRLAATGNRIGGDTPSSENEISFSGSDGVLIAGVEGSENEVGRNHGVLNEGPFIKLSTHLSRLEPIGPNGGIKAPGFSSAATTGATGTAEPGATVRLFRKEGGEPGELKSFLGEGVANAQGSWQVQYPAAIPAGTHVAVTQTNLEGGTSELGFAMTAGAVGGDTPPPGKTHNRDTVPPQTRITKGPELGRSATATFVLRSTEKGSAFECRLGSNPFRSCHSPVAYRHLAPGRYRFQARAIDAAGNVDPTPVRRTFVVQRSRNR